MNSCWLWQEDRRHWGPVSRLEIAWCAPSCTFAFRQHRPDYAIREGENGWQRLWVPGAPVKHASNNTRRSQICQQPKQERRNHRNETTQSLTMFFIFFLNRGFIPCLTGAQLLQSFQLKSRPQVCHFFPSPPRREVHQKGSVTPLRLRLNPPAAGNGFKWHGVR